MQKDPADGFCEADSFHVPGEGKMGGYLSAFLSAVTVHVLNGPGGSRILLPDWKRFPDHGIQGKGQT